MDRDAIVKDVVNVLNDMTTDWEAGFQGKIGPDTLLVADLGFESIDVVQLAVALEEHFGQEGLPFDKMLMTEGRYVDDLRVEQVVSFLAEHLRS
jgi:acyl carrier protein